MLLTLVGVWFEIVAKISWKLLNLFLILILDHLYFLLNSKSLKIINSCKSDNIILVDHCLPYVIHIVVVVFH